MQPFQNTNIQVASIEAKMASTGNMKYILTATDKKKYYFFQKVKGTDSDVFQVFNNMGVKQGSIINIGFTEEEKSFDKTENGKPKTVKYIDRYIGSMREADAVPAQTPTLPQKAPVKSNLSEPAYVSEQKDEKFWDKKAYKQCLWGQALKVGLENFGSEDCDLVWNTFKSIEMDATRRFSVDKEVLPTPNPRMLVGTENGQFMEEPLPQDPGEINVESIPF